MLQAKLSDLTPAVVDGIYNIGGARPAAEPVFLFLVGAPGSGKSSGHARAIDAGILPAGDYATVNMDNLLESLLPFRAASSMAHHLKARFSSIGAYGSRKENLGLFKWYDDAHEDLRAADPISIHAFNRVRNRFTPLKDKEAVASLLEINEAALDRAIQKRVNIVFETTLSLTKKGRVNKVDHIMNALKKTPYRVVFYHITGSVADVRQRIKARQEHGTPQEFYPFYRYLPTSQEKVTEYIKGTAAAFTAVREQYTNAAAFEEFENPLRPDRLPSENRRSASTRRRKIVSAYASSYNLSSNRPDLYVSPTTSETRRSTRRRTRSSYW